MKRNFCFPALLLPVLWILPALRGDPFDRRLSPDGRFRFEAFSVEDNDAGRRPAFGIVETSSGRLVSDPDEELGDAFRPSETIHWAHDSLSYALTSRVGTRHLDTFFYRWNGTAFERAIWEGAGQLETWADEEVRKDADAQGLPENAGLGQCLYGDDLVERWLDPSRVILTCVEEYLIGGDESETTASGSSRAIVRWNPEKEVYEVERRLPVAEPWPVRIESTNFSVLQDNNPDREGRATITVTHPESGKSLELKAEHFLTAPLLVHTDDEWPALELVTNGPEGFEWRRLYRVVDGSYRCTRIVELTHFPEQAPEDAAPFWIEPGSFAYVLRDRAVNAGDPESYESFQTEAPGPGGRWKAVFTYHPQYLQRIEVVAVDGGAEPSVIYDFDDGRFGLEAFAKPLWNPDGSALALYLQDGPRAGATRLYREHNRVWSEAGMPGIDYGFLESANGAKNAHRGRQLESPLFWKNPRQLVLSLEGNLRGDEGFEYRGIATLGWDETGRPTGCVTVPTSLE